MLWAKKRRSTTHAQSVNFNCFFQSLPFRSFGPIEALNYQLGFKPESREGERMRERESGRIGNRLSSQRVGGDGQQR